MPKVCFCTPTFFSKPKEYFSKSLEASIPLVREAGWEEGCAVEMGNGYISYARALLLSRALEWGADYIFYLDHDLSWEPAALLKVLQAPGDVVAGTYRFKSPDEEYMGSPLFDSEGKVPVRRDGMISMLKVPAGFLKLSRTAVEMIIAQYPQLDFSRADKPHMYDVFNHGVILKTWFGEDYAFCFRWNLMKQKIWCVPDLNINHHGVNSDGTEFEFPGNYHQWLSAQSAKESADRAPRDRESSLEMHVCSKETEDGTGSRYLHGEIR